jgi:hypothetical protein
MPRRKKNNVLPPPSRPTPYWLSFYTYVDGSGIGSVEVTFKVDAGSGEMGRAALDLLHRKLFDEPEGFKFKLSEHTVECAVRMPSFDFTIFDVAEKKQQAEEFFSKVVNEVDKIKTVMDSFTK